jgi:hypothetical protein
MVEIKSNLIDRILSVFAKSHIELLSPTYIVLKKEEASSTLFVDMERAEKALA